MRATGDRQTPQCPRSIRARTSAADGGGLHHGFADERRRAWRCRIQNQELNSEPLPCLINSAGSSTYPARKSVRTTRATALMSGGLLQRVELLEELHRRMVREVRDSVHVFTSLPTMRGCRCRTMIRIGARPMMKRSSASTTAIDLRASSASSQGAAPATGRVRSLRTSARTCGPTPSPGTIRFAPPGSSLSNRRGAMSDAHTACLAGICSCGRWA